MKSVYFSFIFLNLQVYDFSYERRISENVLSNGMFRISVKVDVDGKEHLALEKFSIKDKLWMGYGDLAGSYKQPLRIIIQ